MNVRLLELDGEDLPQRPRAERKAMLEQLLRRARADLGLGSNHPAGRRGRVGSALGPPWKLQDHCHRCRMHGGAKASGGPRGERNGRYTEGRFTKAAKQAARERRRAVRVATAMVRHFVDVIEGREEEMPAFARPRCRLSPRKPLMAIKIGLSAPRLGALTLKDGNQGFLPLTSCTRLEPETRKEWRLDLAQS
jgi:hypothetical protein